MEVNGSGSIHGRMASGAFETVGRAESWAEQRVAQVNVVGRLDQLGGVKPGDSMASHASWFDGKLDGNYYVRTVNLSSPDGVTGELTLSLLLCAAGKTKPYNVTWDVTMEEVQMRLINHPSIIANADIDVLLMWEDTPKGRRVKKNGDALEYWYEEYVGSASGVVSYKQVTGEWNIAYCAAVTQGIETYNKYLPVIVKNSYYLELPGVDYDLNTHVVTGGTISEFTGAGEIGRFSEPEMTVRGYTQADGVWFKNCDKFTSGADGTWTRTEGWVFTNDPRHRWIYTGEL